MQFGFLSTVVALLDDAEIPHMLAGSMASTFHGEPRMTRGIDMVIDPTLESIERFVSGLDRSRYYVDGTAEAVRRRDMCNVIDTETGWKVHLIVRKDRSFSREEFRRRQPAVIGGVRLFVATAEDTVLAKLEGRAPAGRSLDRPESRLHEQRVGRQRRFGFGLGLRFRLDDLGRLDVVVGGIDGGRIVLGVPECFAAVASSGVVDA